MKNEPAFPSDYLLKKSKTSEQIFAMMGLNKRQYAAIKICASMWVNPNLIAKVVDKMGPHKKLDEVISKMAVDSADAVIKELEK